MEHPKKIFQSLDRGSCTRDLVCWIPPAICGTLGLSILFLTLHYRCFSIGFDNKECGPADTILRTLNILFMIAAAIFFLRNLCYFGQCCCYETECCGERMDNINDPYNQMTAVIWIISTAMFALLYLALENLSRWGYPILMLFSLLFTCLPAVCCLPDLLACCVGDIRQQQGIWWPFCGCCHCLFLSHERWIRIRRRRPAAINPPEPVYRRGATAV